MSRFKIFEGNWIALRDLGVVEINLHVDDRRPHGVSYQDVMYETYREAKKALIEHQATGVKAVLFVHGHSTSRSGSTTKRSMIRRLMRSKESTPFIIRKDCVEHETAFLAVLRPLPRPE